MRITELFEDFETGRIESPDQSELDLEEIDYEGSWREILEYPDTDSKVSVEEQITRALKASGARPVLVGDIRKKLYITGDDVIELDDFGCDIKSKDDWINEADIDEYFPDYEQHWNDEFWKHPSTLYHATVDKNLKSILKHGLSPQNKTRGMSNRSVGSAVFTTSEWEETVQGSYGDNIFEIDTESLSKNPDRPFASQEPDIVEYDLRDRLARYIEYEEYWSDSESGISPYTVILHGSVGPQYIKLATG